MQSKWIEKNLQKKKYFRYFEKCLTCIKLWLSFNTSNSKRYLTLPLSDVSKLELKSKYCNFFLMCLNVSISIRVISFSWSSSLLMLLVSMKSSSVRYWILFLFIFSSGIFKYLSSEPIFLSLFPVNTSSFMPLK